jgi:dipeptidyl aminopeptidase/acylaminoacyl peptidase
MRFCFALVLTLFITPAPGKAQDEFTIADFAAPPHMGNARLSPDGTMIAYTSSNEGVEVLVVRDLDGGEVRGVDISGVRTENVRWLGNALVSIRTSRSRDLRGLPGDVDFRSTYIYDLENEMHRQRYGSRIIGVESHTGRVLMSQYRRTTGRRTLESHDIPNNTSRVVGIGRPYTRTWAVDAVGDVIARYDFNARPQRQLIRASDGDSWRTIAETRQYDRPSFRLEGVLPDGRLAISDTMISNITVARHRLYAMSPETGDIEDVMFSHGNFDFSHVIQDENTNLVVGAVWYNDYRETIWFDAQLSEVQQLVDAALPGQHVAIQSWSADRSIFLLRARNNNLPTTYYVYDRSTNKIDGLALSRAALSTGALANRHLTEYPARDGIMIPAYITRPTADAPLPTVILPHGGPDSRDVGGFSFYAHFLASRGYLVLQPNFRGSSGYGHAWTRAGRGQWGNGLMQDDITDGVAALVGAGLADPDRICIVGHGYGGYSAMAGATFTPSLYACAVSIGGPSDLQEMYEYVDDRAGYRIYRQEMTLESYLGYDRRHQTRRLLAISPRHHAGQIEIPILLLHGEQDAVYPVEQSRDMNNSLRRAGVDVRYVELHNADHSLSTVEWRTTVLTELEAFLAEHIGN